MRLRRTKRGGFTLMELLVVMAIIAVLSGLLVGAVVSFMNTGPQTATRTNLRTIAQKWATHWKAVNDKAGRDSIPQPIVQRMITRGDASSGSDDRARPIYKSLALAQAFPTTFAQVFVPDPNYPEMTFWPPYVTFLGTLGITSANVASNTTPAEVQQAVLLLMALERGPQNTGVTADSWGSSAVAKLTVNTPSGNRQVEGFVDGWRIPIVFTRSYSGKPTVASAGRNNRYGANPYDVTSDPDAADNVVVDTP